MEGREETRTRAERAGAERRRERSSSRRSLGERKVSALSFSTSASASSSCLSSESSSRVRTRTFFICRRVIFLKEARGREGEGGGIERGRQKNGKKMILPPYFFLSLLSFSSLSLKCAPFSWRSARMLSSSSSSRAASLSMTPRLAAAGRRRDGVVVAVSSMPPLLSPSLPTLPHSSSSFRPQWPSRRASSRRASVTAKSSRSEGYGNMGVTARWCLDAR